MRDRDLYARILGVAAPWAVTDVQLNDAKKAVEVFLEHRGDIACPECGQVCGRYDARERRWRHLDTLQFQTILVAQVPRADCADHGVRQVPVPWAEGGSRFTALFEALVIDWLGEASISGVCRLVRLTWDEVDGIMKRAVARGLARRQLKPPTALGIDETSFRKHHDYVTVIADQTGAVVHVADDRKRAAVAAYLAKFTRQELAELRTVAMDMWAPYIRAVEAGVPDGASKIAFDKFHVAQHLGDAVDRVRRSEHRSLHAAGDDRLTGTKHLWLTNRETWSDAQRRKWAELRGGSLRTARAWAIKSTAMTLWNYTRRAAATKAWEQWYGWAIRSRLEPVRKVARMVKAHLQGIVNAVISGVTNARAEGLNSVVQWIKYTARGFRNRERFKTAIYFHLGGLDLYPAGVVRTR